MLQKWQKNDVLSLIRDYEFDPTHFRWGHMETHDRGVTVDPLAHVPTGYWFRFIDRGTWLYQYSPGGAIGETSGNAGSWEYELAAADTWLDALRREVDAPDLWAELETGGVAGELPEDVASVENTSFTPDEVTQIARQLEEVKHYLRQTHELSEQQYRELETRLDYLAGAATRVPRLDWRNAMLGVLLGVVVQGLLPQEPVRDALQMILRGLAALFGHEIPQLPS